MARALGLLIEELNTTRPTSLVTVAPSPTASRPVEVDLRGWAYSRRSVAEPDLKWPSIGTERLMGSHLSVRRAAASAPQHDPAAQPDQQGEGQPRPPPLAAHSPQSVPHDGHGPH